MSKSASSPSLIHRNTILDNLRALYFAHYQTDHILKEESYACGYRDGFENALLSVAHSMGISVEFEEIVKQINTSKKDKMLILR